MMGLDTPETCRGWRNILRISCASSWFFFTRLDIHLANQTGPAAQPASCTMGTESIPRVKRQGSGFDHPPHLPPKLKESKAIPPLPLWAFMACSKVNFFCAFRNSFTPIRATLNAPIFTEFKSLNTFLYTSLVPSCIAIGQKLYNINAKFHLRP